MLTTTRRVFLQLLGSALAACGLPVRAAPVAPAPELSLRCSVCGKTGRVTVTGPGSWGVEVANAVLQKRPLHIPEGTPFSEIAPWRICPDLRPIAVVSRDIRPRRRHAQSPQLTVVTQILGCRGCADAQRARAAVAPRQYALPMGQRSLDWLMLEPLLEGLPLKPQ